MLLVVVVVAAAAAAAAAAISRHLRDLLSVEVQQQFFFVVSTEENDLIGGARGQNALDCGPQEFKNARCIEQQTATEALGVIVLPEFALVSTAAQLDGLSSPEGARLFECTN